MTFNGREIATLSSLSGIPGFVYCEKFRCRLTPEACAKRRKQSEQARKVYLNKNEDSFYYTVNRQEMSLRGSGASRNIPMSVLGCIQCEGYK